VVFVNPRVGVCAFLLTALAIGCSQAAVPTGTVTPSAASTAFAGATVSATAVASPTSAATAPTLGHGEGPLAAGTYRIDPTNYAGPGTEFPALLATMPDGWHALDGWALRRPRSDEDIPPVSVSFWGVDQIYRHPCQWKGTEFQPGPTVEDLAQALVDVPLRNATQPVDVSLDGYRGMYLEWSVPSDIEMDAEGDFPACDKTADGHRDFKSWIGNAGGGRYQQSPGQVDRLWILDVDGARLVIDAFSMPAATSDEIGELVHVVESITFDP